MKNLYIINKLNTIQDKHKGRLIILGFFDGLHLGHQSLIKEGLALSKELGVKPLVLTMLHKFKKADKFVLTTPKEKVYLFNYFFNLNVDDIIFMNKTDVIYNMSAYEFVYRLVNKPFFSKGLVCGQDFRFGRAAEGDVNLLKEFEKNFDFLIKVVNLKNYDSKKISTSYIKELIKEGNFLLVNKLLGYHYFLTGKVILGKQISRKVGFPTANLRIDKNKLLPPYGVYAVKVFLDNQYYLGALNIMQDIAEVHIINFSADIYNRELKIFILDKIRDIIKFLNLEEARKVISKDIKEIQNKYGGIEYVS